MPRGALVPGQKYERPPLPLAAGETSRAIIEVLTERASGLGKLPLPGGDILVEDDFQLSLYLLYELHYRGFEDVSSEWEWNLELLSLRATLEEAFLEALVSEVGPPVESSTEDMDLQLFEILDSSDVPAMPRYLETQATLAQFTEFIVHRSAYQLKEADPHSWAIPRIGGAPKAALIEIQADEYGEGKLAHMHSELFAETMREMGLDDRYGRYISFIPGVTLATVNVMSFFGLHHRWRGAIIGHLAAFEMGSSLPNRRYSNGLRRLGCSKAARAFFDVHVLADAVHENIAAVDLAGGFAKQHPSLSGDVLFGARALGALEARFFDRLLDCWTNDELSLRDVEGIPVAS